MLFEDESMIETTGDSEDLVPSREATRIIPTTGKHRGVKLLATVDYETGHIVWQEDEQYTAETFLSFLQRSWRLIQQGNWLWFWTMPGFIMQSLLRPFLEAQKNRLELVYLPPYSPQLNIVEGLWKWLKSSVINNVFYSAVSEIRLRVGQFMDEIMKHPHAIIDRLCVQLLFSFVQLIYLIVSLMFTPFMKW
ncbi:transposase [Paenibacillus larvae]|nr:transposase [Paenibacillus larvae]MDT2276925.1 transposase [Paenibacillus larvae]